MYGLPRNILNNWKFPAKNGYEADNKRKGKKEVCFVPRKQGIMFSRNLIFL